MCRSTWLWIVVPRHEGGVRRDPSGDFLRHPPDPGRGGLLAEPLVVGVAKPVVGREIAGHPGEPCEPRELVEDRAERAGEVTASSTVGREPAEVEPAADRLDEGGGHIRVVSLVGISHADMPLDGGHHDAGDVVP